MIAQVFLAQPGAGAFERTLLVDSEFRFAGDIVIVDCGDACEGRNRHEIDLLEAVFAITNSYPGEMHCGENYAAQVAKWRADRNRSLSMGDVVALGEAFWFCASTGWEMVSPTQNLMDAFMEANRRQLEV